MNNVWQGMDDWMQASQYWNEWRKKSFADGSIFALEHSGEYRGYRYMTGFDCSKGFRCGYVELLGNEGITRDKWMELMLGERSMGLSFCGHLHEIIQKKWKSNLVIGFDFGHICHGADYETWERLCGRKHIRAAKTLGVASGLDGVPASEQTAVDECRCIIDQLIERRG
jgi:hypothetical protein